MQVVNQTTRYYAHVCYVPLPGTDHLLMADAHFCASPHIAVRVGLYLTPAGVLAYSL